MPQDTDHTVILLLFSADRFAETLQETVDEARGLVLGFISQKIFFRRFSNIGDLEMSLLVIIAVAGATYRNQMNIHDRQSRHYERSQRTDIDRRIDCLENTNNEFLELDITDHDLRVAGASDHPRIALVK